jgi:membrane-associated protein
MGPLHYLLDPSGLLSDVVVHGGIWVYVVIFAIVFAETGLVVTPFLPGDSLLFAAGAMAGAQRLQVWAVGIVVLAAAVAGDAVNYLVGRVFGARIAGRDGRFVKRRHIEATQRFFEKHGGKALVLARFVPVARTFAPFVSGLGGMKLGRFWRYNIVGAVVWVVLFVGAGYFFGTIPWVEKNLTIVMLAIVVVSVVPLVYKAGRGYLATRNKATTQD